MNLQKLWLFVLIFLILVIPSSLAIYEGQKATVPSRPDIVITNLSKPGTITYGLRANFNISVNVSNGNDVSLRKVFNPILQ